MKEQEHNFYQYEEEFRDTLATVDEKGKRVWVYPKKPTGYYHTLRIWVTVFLLTLFFVGPFLQWQGRPFLLFNIFERKFILFGQVFWPQDFFLLALTLITFFVFVILFTVVFGRLWCGWACPQTLFMEMVFRKIEYWIEGDANAQRRLNNSKWTREKLLKKTSKQIIFILISLIISHATMAYLIGLDQVKEIVSNPPTEHLAGFIGLIVFTALFYGVFAWFREQACIAVCPYGRLQGVLLVKDSIVVAYDWLRGEPKGKLKKNQLAITEKQGDCIDCKLCVHVCPTGIDIRNGTQLECVNCTACMDACDDVMTKISKPKGLIRYSSHNAISQGKQKLFTARVGGYVLVLTALISLLSYFVFTRADIETTILKVPGTLYTKTDDGQITNLYSIEFVNKTFNDIDLTVKIESPARATYMKIGDPEIVVPKEGILKGMIMVKLPEDAISTAKTVIKLGIYQGDEKLETATARFIGPIKIKPKSTE
jgi:cytochrome c oxidase accessory protein FixG